MLCIKLKVCLFLFTLVSNTYAQQSCTCNLLDGSCDVNCCCDPNCSENDTATFSTCIETEFNTNELLCSYDQVVYVNNLPQVTTVQQGGLFCLQTDNFAQRNFYVDPACVATNTCFDSIGQTYSFSTDSVGSTTTDVNYYLSGDAIFVQYSSDIQRSFVVPTNGISNECQNNNPVQYLIDSQSTCTRLITNLTDSCQTDAALKYETYQNFEIFSIPPGNYTPQLINFTSSCIVDGVGNSTCSTPVVSGNNCANVVTSTSYTLSTSGFSGIISAEISYTLQTISEAELPLSQSFTVNFQTSDSTATNEPQRSGNPGYLLNYPLISASRIQDDATLTVTNVSQTTDLNDRITLINPDASGSCITSANAPRISVVFGKDVRTGCQVQLSGTSSVDCINLQNTIRQALDGQTFDAGRSLFVGSFGNSLVTNLNSYIATDWVQVVRDTFPTDVPSVQPTGCSGMILSSKYEVLYVNTGSILNPQAKIVGVRYTYGSPEFVRFQSSTNNQMVQVFTSVNFIDISETPVSIESQRPSIEARLPNDFFFPLKNSGSLFHFNYALIIYSVIVLGMNL